MILDGERLTEQLFGERLDPRDLLVRMYADTTGIQDLVPPLEHVVLTAPPLVARVNHGVWTAPCPCGARGVPRPGCVVFMETLLGWCMRCQNGATGRGWRPVTVPPADIRDQIEAVLSLRPGIGDRNWEPHETVDDLVAQNREHGDPVPADDEPPADPAPVPAAPRWPAPGLMAAVLAPFKRRRRR